MSKEFQIYKKNTEAIATNRGFYYQYLKTVELWINNFIEKIDNDIYCEREDDIFEYNIESERYVFRQVKCYSNNVGLNSLEIKSSLLHFFDLYENRRYKDKSEFYVESNQGFMPKAGTELKDWYQEQKEGNYSGENYIDKTKEVLKEYVGDSLASYKNKNNSEDDKKKAEKKVKEFNEKLESDSFKKFVSCIRWSFSEESDTNKEIANLSQDILETIFNELQYDNRVEKELLLGYLVNEVLQKSIEKDEDKRLLNNEMLQNALELTEISDSAFDKDIKELFKNSFFIINEKLDSIKEDTKNLAPIENENLEKRLKEEYETFEEIPLLLDETKQNNIEDDISNIISGMKEKDEKKQNKIKDFIINLETVIKVEDNENKQKEEKETIQIDNLLERLSETPKLLIYGDAGIGKTTLCKYIAYKWVKDKLTKFDYVIYLPLRVWESKGLAGAIKDYYYNEEENRSFELIDNIHNYSQDILFLFDGYDELNEKKKSDLKQNHLPKLENYIIVSRPIGYNENEFNIDKAYQSIGYLPNDISEYIDKFFDSSQQNLDLKHFLEQNTSIAYLAHIPLILEIICVLWKQKKSKLSDSMTMTELYREVVESILAKHFEQDRSVSTCLKKTRVKYELGKLAFDGLKQQKILFDCNFLAKVVDYNSIDFFETHVIKSGFLKPENTPIEFLHLTFQEYFSAYYINTLSQDEQREIIKEYKFFPHMQMFFAFLAGLIEDKEFLLQEIESEPKDLVGIYEFNLVLQCLGEIREVEKNRKKEIFQNFFELIEAKINGLFIKLIIPVINDDFWIKFHERDAYNKKQYIKYQDMYTKMKDRDIRSERNKYNGSIKNQYLEIIRSFLQYGKNHENILKNILIILEDTNSDKGTQLNIVDFFSNALEFQISQQVVLTFIKMIKNKDSYEKNFIGRIAFTLLLFENNISECRNELLEIVEDRKVYKPLREQISSLLISIGERDNILQILYNNLVSEQYKIGKLHTHKILIYLNDSIVIVNANQLYQDIEDYDILIRILLYIVDSKKEFLDIERWVVGRFLFFNPIQLKRIDQQFIEVLLSIISRIQNKDLKYHFIKFLIYLSFPQPLIFDKIFEIIDRQNLKLRNYIRPLYPKFWKGYSLDKKQALIKLIRIVKNKTIKNKNRGEVLKSLIFRSIDIKFLSQVNSISSDDGIYQLIQELKYPKNTNIFKPIKEEAVITVLKQVSDWNSQDKLKETYTLNDCLGNEDCLQKLQELSSEIIKTINEESSGSYIKETTWSALLILSKHIQGVENIVIKKAIQEEKPLYLKGNKLYIENGKEVGILEELNRTNLTQLINESFGR
ncbi:NACHT domain-containing protein [bacterium]|nr:NACHT domain-containing protein [bacterium]MBU1959268.1 NACHT domain-containing protein [bacterium]